MATMAGSKDARIVVVGAGPMGCATLAHLSGLGHVAALCSPTASRLEQSGGMARFDVRGALERSMEVELLPDWKSLQEFDVLIFCLPANALSTLLPQLRDAWRVGQNVIISGALSLSPLAVHQAARKEGIDISVCGWGTTLTTAHFLEHGCVHINPMRARIDLAVVDGPDRGHLPAMCKRLFGDRFVEADNLLTPTLANINPIAHAAEVIPNLTRMDKGENWSLFGNFTTPVSRIAEALDKERLAVAGAFGLKLPSLQEHYANSYGVTRDRLDRMAASISNAGMSPNGPGVLEHRYVVEDAPFGLAVLERLALLCNVETPVLTASITMLETVYDCDFRSNNAFLEALGFDRLDAASLYSLCAASRMEDTPRRVASECL